MLMLVCNRALFTHTHKLKDGTLIEHAHPFDKAGDTTPLKSHHHTASAFLFFENLALLFITLIAAIVIAAVAEVTSFILLPVNQPAFVLLKLNKGRAPPLI